MSKKKTKSKNQFLKFITSSISSNKDRIELFENIGSMLAVNINIEKVLSDLILQAKSSLEKKYLDDMLKDLENGIPFWRIIEKSNFLSGQALALIKIGEATGTLGKNMEVVLEQIRKDKEFKSKIRSASLYPTIVLIIMIIVINIVGIFILPRLANVYASFGTTLPLPTRIMIEMGNFMGKYGILAGSITMMVMTVLYFILFVNSKTKFIGQSIFFMVPGLSKMLIELEIGRFGFNLKSLLSSGISVPKSFKLLAESSDFSKYKKLYSYISEEVNQGQTFPQSFHGYKGIDKYFPSYPRQLLINGVNTGKLIEYAEKIGKTYEQRSEITLKNIEVVFEPMLLLLVWVGVLFVALSVLLPIYSLTGSLTNLM